MTAAPAADGAVADATPPADPPVEAAAAAAGGASARGYSSGSKPSSPSSSGSKPSSSSGNRPYSSSSNNRKDRYDDDDDSGVPPWRVGVAIVGGLAGFMLLVGVWILVMNKRKAAKEAERGVGSGEGRGKW